MADFSSFISSLNQSGKPMERVLGSKQARDAVAKFTEAWPDVFQSIAIKSLYDFATMNTFDEKEYAAYQKAIMDFGTCLDRCREESKMETMEKKETM